MEKLCVCIPVYVSVCIYTTYLTPFPEVIKQEISLPLSFPSPLLSLTDFGSVEEYNHFVFEISELLTYYPEWKHHRGSGIWRKATNRYLIHRNAVLLTYLFN